MRFWREYLFKGWRYKSGLPGTHPSDVTSWSASRCGSAHKKQLWTRTLVWLFLHIDKPLVWHHGWIYTAPEDKSFKKCILSYTYRLWLLDKNIGKKTKNTLLVTWNTNSCDIKSKWACWRCEWVMADGRWSYEWDEMRKFWFASLLSQSIQEIVFLDLSS